MLKYLIAAVMLCVTAGISYLTLDQSRCRSCRVFDLLSSGANHESLTISKKTVLLLTAVIGAVAFVVTVQMFRRTSDTVTRVRMLAIILPLVATAWIDLREKRIPNVLPLYLLILGLAFLSVEYFRDQEIFSSYAVSCLLAFGGTALLLGIVSAVTHMGIGAGDIKLLATLGLAGGVYTLCGTIIFCTALCAVVGISLLILKKKTLKSSLPFGPFILLGYILTLLFYPF